MNPATSVRILSARSGAEIAEAVALMRAYGASLGIDLAYQGFDAELAGMPGKYAPPGGALLLAVRGDRALGCVGLRPIAPEGCCEMKRLYVAPEGRGLGIGRALVEAVLAAATRIGYREIRLDSLPTMEKAVALYRRAGFRDTPPYYDTPVAGTVFLARPLASAGAL